MKEMIIDVLDDIDILDEETKKIIDEKIKQLNVTNNARKDEIKKNSPVEDNIDDRNLKLKLLREDHMKYRHMLKIIQKICHRKGWFE